MYAKVTKNVNKDEMDCCRSCDEEIEKHVEYLKYRYETLKNELDVVRKLLEQYNG